MKIGYARVSTVGQDLQLQREKLEAMGVPEDRIYFDRGFSGKKMSRDGLQQALVAARAGDEFIVPAMDRLARNTSGALEVVSDLVERGVIFNMGGMVYDPANPMAKLFLTILAAVAEAEGGWISLRTAEAMQHPKVRANLKARPPRHDPVRDAKILADFEARDADNHGVHTMGDLTRIYKTSRASIYRAIDRATVARALTRAREAARIAASAPEAHREGGSLN